MTLTHIPCDWHIHTRHSTCGHPEATLERVAEAVESAGIMEYGFSDHLHTMLNVPAMVEARKAFDTLPPSPHRYFGVEVTCVREYDLAMNERDGENGNIRGARLNEGPDGPLTIYLPDELEAEVTFDYVIGSTHTPLGLIEPYSPEDAICCYHRQHMFLATHPKVDIIGHPWQWSWAWLGEDHQYHSHPWFDDFRRIPQSMHNEFAAALQENGKAVEINAQGVLLNPCYPASFHAQYLDYLAFLKEQGIRFSLGSDSHDGDYNACLPQILPDLSTLGLKEDDLWRPYL